MSIEFRCHQCNKLLRVDDSSAGRKARCPECGNIQDVPATSTMSSGPVSDYAYYGQSTPAAALGPAAVPMSAPPPPTRAAASPPLPPITAPPKTAPPTHAAAGSPFAPRPAGAVNPYADQAPVNPYAAPRPTFAALSPAERTQRARARVKPPAILLMVASLLFFALAALFLLGLVVSLDERDEAGVAICTIAGALSLVCGCVPIVCGWLMMGMRAYGLCLAGVIVLMVLAVVFCPLFIAFTIWPLIVLLDSDVKAAFR